MYIHFDEARAAAEKIAAAWVETALVTRVLLLSDLFGNIQLLVWANDAPELTALEDELTRQCGVWWRGPVLVLKADDADVSSNVYLAAWRAAAGTRDAKFATLDRHRSRTGWFSEVPTPTWSIAESEPPVVVFYSFKGGMGRSTTLSSFAIQRAQAGERVCVIDFDLDSPGVGLLLNHGDGTARWGVVDFLLEHATAPPLADYYHRCDRVAGAGEILVFPAGTLDEMYVHKLARIDLEEAPSAHQTGIGALLTSVRDVLRPHWILLDARTGVSEVAGYLLSGIAHLHVLLGNEHDQSWRGLSLVLDRLGRRRLFSRNTQAEILLVQSMVPAGEAGRLAKQAFEARAEREFTASYYAEATEDSTAEALWDVRDIDSGDAPHVAVTLEYDPHLASFRDIEEIADVLAIGSYAALSERILGRFIQENP